MTVKKSPLFLKLRLSQSELVKPHITKFVPVSFFTTYDNEHLSLHLLDQSMRLVQYKL